MIKFVIVGFGELLVDKLYAENGNCIKIDGGDTTWNILYNLSMMGERCYAVATIGNDEYGQIAINSLKNIGVNISGIEINNKKTNILHGTLKDKLDSQDITYTNIDPNSGELTVNLSIKYPTQLPGEIREDNIIVVLTNLHQSNLEFLKLINTEKKVILDLGHVERLDEVGTEDIKSFLNNVNVCQINNKVISSLLKRLNIDSIEQLENQYHFDLLIVTKGSKEAEMFYRNENKVCSIDLQPKEIEKVVEPSGAGDMFLSVFIKAYNRYLAQGKSIDIDFISKTFQIANKWLLE